MPKRENSIQVCQFLLNKCLFHFIHDVIFLVIGRDKEIDRCIQILLRQQKNNAILIGEPVSDCYSQVSCVDGVDFGH